MDATTGTTTSPVAKKAPMPARQQWLLIGLIGVSLVHGWFFLRYGSASPCEAGVERLLTIAMPQLESRLAGNPFQGLGGVMARAFKPTYVAILREKGVLVCYEAAFGLLDAQFSENLNQR